MTTECIKAGVTSKALGLGDRTTKAWLFRLDLDNAGASRFLIRSDYSPSVAEMIDKPDEEIKGAYDSELVEELARPDIDVVNKLAMALAKKMGLI